MKYWIQALIISVCFYHKTRDDQILCISRQKYIALPVKLFSHPIVSDSLQPHELQCAMPPYPSQGPVKYSCFKKKGRRKTNLTPMKLLSLTTNLQGSHEIDLLNNDKGRMSAKSRLCETLEKLRTPNFQCINCKKNKRRDNLQVERDLIIMLTNYNAWA